MRFEGRRVIITILDSKIDEVYEAEQLETEKKIRRNAALELAGLWKSHDNTVSVDKIVRGLRREGSLIIDTDVLIWFLRGNEKAVNEIINAGSFSVSIITYMELLQGMRNKQEMEQMKKSFDKMGIQSIAN